MPIKDPDMRKQHAAHYREVNREDIRKKAIAYNRQRAATRNNMTVEQYLESRRLHKEKERKKERIRKVTEKLKRIHFVEQYKMQHPCKCGQAHPACLDFHHRDPSEKVDNISEIVMRKSMKQLLLGNC